jgi:putative flippase GtrA
MDTVIRRQFFRYATVGVISNLILYLSYLLLTYVGIGHKTAMSLLYAVGTCLTFAFNRNWTFGHDGHITKAFMGYVTIYAGGYLFNLIALYFLVDELGFNHQWVQGGLIILVAVLLFILQKFVVFKKNENTI